MLRARARAHAGSVQQPRSRYKKKLRRPERKLEINLTLSTQPANILLNQGNYTVSIIEGDGIGPEISQAVKDIFAAAKVCPENHSLNRTRRSRRRRMRKY